MRQSLSPAALACTDVDVSVARGTFEPGALGLFVGDAVHAAVQSRLQPRSVSSYAVNHPADLSEPASVQQGNRDLADPVTSQAAACPRQRFVPAGYSQGASVVDNSIGTSCGPLWTTRSSPQRTPASFHPGSRRRSRTSAASGIPSAS
ncbi:cutinase family protein [Amycolatopsis sp. Hca4]|uniref:cutinase family protein n=1 Tax=Amycolatopsis sp. Hca4 TaxID=2742131 RepID=UPI001590C281|nr:cutinase family protein [Amycolatopsis sp. Hca4]QKV80245.1 cutinase family protein [Amycolatopsis sp. Hca4]